MSTPKHFRIVVQEIHESGHFYADTIATPEFIQMIKLGDANVAKFLIDDCLAGIDLSKRRGDGPKE
jgi:hypothetical protein